MTFSQWCVVIAVIIGGLTVVASLGVFVGMS